MVTNKSEMSGIERLEAMLDAGRPTEEETAAQREFKRKRYPRASSSSGSAHSEERDAPRAIRRAGHP